MNVKKSVLIIYFMLMMTIIPISQANVHNNTNNMENTWEKTYGRFFNDEMGASKRTVFILDEEGTVIWHKIYPIKEVPDMEEIIKALE